MKAAADSWEEIAILKDPDAKFKKKELHFCGPFSMYHKIVTDECEHGYVTLTGTAFVKDPKPCPYGCFAIQKIIRGRKKLK